MQFFPTQRQMRQDVLRFSFAPLRLCGRKFFAIAIGLSFFATLVPIVGASAGNSTMPCCVGKAGHCDSGLAAKKPAPPKEPMCGLHNDPAEDDGITIVAEPTHTESHKHAASSSSGPAAESASLSQPCRMECGACAASSSRQQNRERSILQLVTQQQSSTTSQSKYDSRSLIFSSNEDWKQTSPRGPPSELR